MAGLLICVGLGVAAGGLLHWWAAGLEDRLAARLARAERGKEWLLVGLLLLAAGLWAS